MGKSFEVLRTTLEIKDVGQQMHISETQVLLSTPSEVL